MARAASANPLCLRMWRCANAVPLRLAFLQAVSNPWIQCLAHGLAAEVEQRAELHCMMAVRALQEPGRLPGVDWSHVDAGL